MKCECMSVYRNGGKTLSQSIIKLQKKKKKRNHNNKEWRHDITKKKKNKETVLLRYVLRFLFCSFIANRKGD